MAEPTEAAETTTDNRRHGAEPAAAPPVARVRDDDLEPHEGLRYIAKLFKVLALLLLFMLIAELILGFQQDGMAALGTLMIQATQLVVFACFLWAAGDMAVLLIESNHDLRASRILLGRLNGKFDRLPGVEPPAGTPGPTAETTPPGSYPPRAPR
jgi:hypothetical protein